MDENKSMYSRIIKNLYNNYKYYIAAGIASAMLIGLGIKESISYERAERKGEEIGVMLTDFERKVAAVAEEAERQMSRKVRSKRMPGHVRTGPPIRLGPNSLVRKNIVIDDIKFELGDVVCNETPVRNNRR